MRKLSIALRCLLIGVALFCSWNASAQKFEQLAQTPPMGWNSWNKFACDVSEKLLKEAADALVSSGMRDAGYEYIVVDDCWHGKRDSLGFIHPDPVRFPSGIKALADYIHSKGLKFGIYSCAGNTTCGGKPAGRGHEYQDAIMYAKWGVDYLKYDWCDTKGLNAEASYTTMRDALYAAGRPVVFSLCEWGDNKPWEWGKAVGHLWRTTGDIYGCFDCAKSQGTWTAWGAMKILDMQKNLRIYAGPGHWNDPDMLEVGNGMSINEDRAHFSLWCMIAAPLMAGNDIRSMSKEIHDVLSNKDVIALDQDALGIQGFKYAVKDSVETWFKPLKDGAWAVCFLNRSSQAVKVTFDWMNTSVYDDFSKREIKTPAVEYKLYDLWSKKDLGTSRKLFKGEVPAHDVILFKMTPKL